jgi:hypothetical protein
VFREGERPCKTSHVTKEASGACQPATPASRRSGFLTPFPFPPLAHPCAHLSRKHEPSRGQAVPVDPGGRTGPAHQARTRRQAGRRRPQGQIAQAHIATAQICFAGSQSTLALLVPAQKIPTVPQVAQAEEGWEGGRGEQNEPAAQGFLVPAPQIAAPLQISHRYTALYCQVGAFRTDTPAPLPHRCTHGL